MDEQPARATHAENATDTPAWRSNIRLLARGFWNGGYRLPVLRSRILNFVQRTIVVQSPIARVYWAGAPGPAYTSTPTTSLPLTKLLISPGSADCQGISST